MKDGDARDDSEVAVFSFLERELASLGASVSRRQTEQLTELVSLLAYWGDRINLTGHRSPLQMAERLVLDAVALGLALPELASAKSLADLGSGAGFPGLPLAVLYPGIDIHLIDARLKRIHFQKEVRRRLELDRVESILGRSDEVAAIPCDVVVAQAMAPPRQVLEWMLPWTRESGLLALPASETAVLPDAPKGVGPLELRNYEIPSSGVRRKLWVARKHS